MHSDYLLESYNYPLQEAQIAQYPSEKRENSRLLVLSREKQKNTVSAFKDIAKHLPKNALLVANNSKVVPARIQGTKTSGGKVEFLLLTPLPLLHIQKKENSLYATAFGLIKASKSPKIGQEIKFSEKFQLKILEKGEFGKHKVLLIWQNNLHELFAQLGEMPLPPYIKRKAKTQDATRYQTVYAREDKAGSVAAPTAGLHFSPQLRAHLLEQGMTWAELTLYVGYGTFSPVRCEDIRDHTMHEEYIEIPEQTALAIQEAKEQGRPVVAIGTTSARSIEGMYQACGRIKAFSGNTDIFIYPGYTFKVVDAMLTNFHLPQSSLLMMVSALAGRSFILKSYAKALEQGFKVFSYGDAMLIT